MVGLRGGGFLLLLLMMFVLDFSVEVDDIQGRFSNVRPTWIYQCRELELYTSKADDCGWACDRLGLHLGGVVT